MMALALSTIQRLVQHISHPILPFKDVYFPVRELLERTFELEWRMRQTKKVVFRSLIVSINPLIFANFELGSSVQEQAKCKSR